MEMGQEPDTQDIVSDPVGINGDLVTQDLSNIMQTKSVLVMNLMASKQGLVPYSCPETVTAPTPNMHNCSIALVAHYSRTLGGGYNIFI